MSVNKMKILVAAVKHNVIWCRQPFRKCMLP